MSDPVLQSSNSKKRTVPDDAEDVDLREMKKHRGEPPQSSRQVVSKKRRNRRKKKQPIVMEGDSRAQSQSSLARTAGAKKVSAHLASKSTTKKAFPHAPQPRVDAVVAVAEVANLPESSEEKPAESPAASRINEPTASRSPEPLDSQSATVSQLTKQLDAQKLRLLEHEKALNVIQQSLTCQICLTLLYKPYAMAPCGHVACHSCLVSWFTAPSPEAVDAPVPRTHHNRKKTCPHCRAVIRERPVEVWGIKDMVAGLVKSGLAAIPADFTPAATSSSTVQTDPWQNIFRKPLMDYFMGGNPPRHDDIPIEDIGMFDAEDGGVYRCFDCMHEIWDGVCSGCHRVYPGHDEFDDDEAMTAGELSGFLGLRPDSEEDDDSGEDLHDDGLMGYARALAAPPADWFGFHGGALAADFTEDEAGEEEDYEGSFIDDDDDGSDDLIVPVVGRRLPVPRWRARRNLGTIEVHDSDSNSEPEGRHPTAVRNDQDDVLELSSDHSESENDRREVSLGARVRPVTVRGRRVFLSEEEDEDDETSSQGDDSLPGPPRHLRHLFTAGRNDRLVGSESDESSE